MTQNRTIIQYGFIPILVILFIFGFSYFRQEKPEPRSVENPVPPPTQALIAPSEPPHASKSTEPAGPQATLTKNSRIPAAQNTEEQPQSIETVSPKIEKKQEKPRAVEITNEIPKDIKFWFWFGLGENYQYQQQSVPSVSGQSKFQNIQGPSISVVSGFIGEKLGAEISYKEIPGRMDSSSTVTVFDGHFFWRILSIDGLYKIENSDTALKGGLQFDSVPYMDLNATNSTLTVRANTITTLKFGFEKSYLFSEKFHGEWTMQYQHPVLTGTSNGNTFNIKSEFAFNGSVGAIYKYNEKMHFGIFWYGQWYQYNFEYGSTSSLYLGRQVLFYSNLDLRIGWKF